MKILVLCLVLLSVLFAEPLSEKQLATAFQYFTKKYKKVYGSQTNFEKRFDIFKKNFQKAKKMNEKEGDNVYGMSPFLDLTEEEFRNRYLSKISPSQGYGDKNTFKKLTNEEYAKLKRISASVPSNWTWTEHGGVVRVKNQGSCGSCWSFSAIGNLEGQWALSGHKLVALSEQNLVDCDHECDEEGNCDAGCNGGLMMNAFKYILKNKGVASEEDYPYHGYSGACRTNVTRTATISNMMQLSTDEDIIKAYLYQHGPLAVALNANSLQFYFGGVFDPWFCDPKKLDHGVLLVGYGRDENKGKDYWIVKNSWGSGWGESGYFRIVRGKGKCGINEYVCTSIV